MTEDINNKMKLFIIRTKGFYRMTVYTVVSNNLNKALKLCGITKQRDESICITDNYIYEEHLEFPTTNKKEEILAEYECQE